MSNSFPINYGGVPETGSGAETPNTQPDLTQISLTKLASAKAKQNWQSTKNAASRRWDSTKGTISSGLGSVKNTASKGWNATTGAISSGLSSASEQLKFDDTVNPSWKIAGVPSKVLGLIMVGASIASLVINVINYTQNQDHLDLDNHENVLSVFEIMLSGLLVILPFMLFFKYGIVKLIGRGGKTGMFAGLTLLMCFGSVIANIVASVGVMKGRPDLREANVYSFMLFIASFASAVFMN